MQLLKNKTSVKTIKAKGWSNLLANILEITLRYLRKQFFMEWGCRIALGRYYIGNILENNDINVWIVTVKAGGITKL